MHNYHYRSRVKDKLQKLMSSMADDTYKFIEMREYIGDDHRGFQLLYNRVKTRGDGLAPRMYSVVSINEHTACLVCHGDAETQLNKYGRILTKRRYAKGDTTLQGTGSAD